MAQVTLSGGEQALVAISIYFAILAVNPAILGAAGMDRGAVFTASALAACAATLLMALLSNYPFALAPGMGLNAYFAYTVVIKQGYSWQMALAAVFLEGLLFIVLSVTSVREAIFNSIPRPLKLGVTWGIGLFILFIGLQNSKLIVADPSTMLSVYPFREAIASGEIRSVGLGAVLAFAGILLTAILTIRRVRGALLLGILAVWGAAILCQLTGLYVPNAELGMASVLPDFSAGLAVPSLAPTFMQMDFTGLFTLNFLTVVLSFLFVDVFDTLGGIIGMASQGHMLDENGRLPRIRGALLSDAVGTSVGAVLGTSTTTTFAESAAGIAAGGRTGLTSVVTALMFLLSLFLSPLFLAVPGFATAPALVIVGLSMLGSLRALDPADWRESLPAYLTMVAMPFCYSISEGIAVGTISYVAVHLFTGAESRKKVSPVLAVLALVFLLKYIFL